MGKLIYKPFGIVLGILAGLVSKKLFDTVWGIFDDEEPPKPTTQETNWPKVLAAAAVQGVVFKTVRAVVDRGGAKGFDHLTGVLARPRSGPGEVRRRPRPSASPGRQPPPRRTKPRSASASRSSSKAPKSRASRWSSGRPAGPRARSQRRSTPGPARSAGSSVSASRIGSSGLWSRSPPTTASGRRVEHGQQLLVGEAEAVLQERRGGRGHLEELVLAAEDLGHRVVGEDPADRVGQQLRAAQDADVVRRARAQRDRVGDDDLLEARRPRGSRRRRR